MSTDAFDETNVGKAPIETGSNEVNFLDQLVGEGKKFKTAEDLARGKAESDRYIGELETRSKTDTEGLNSKLDELMTRLSEQTSKSTNPDGSSGQNLDGNKTGTNSDSEGKTAPMDADSVEALVRKAISENQTQTTQESNLNSVNTKLTEMYGERSADIVSTRAKEFGMSVDSLKEMASNSPVAFMALVGQQKQGKTSGQMATFNSDALGANSGNSNMDRGWSHYKALKDKSKAEFYRQYGKMIDKIDSLDEAGKAKFYNS